MACTRLDIANSSLESLRWDGDSITIFFLNENSILSKRSDGTQERKVYEGEAPIRDFLAVEQGLLVLFDCSVVFVPAQGAAATKVLHPPPCRMLHWRPSGNGRKCVVQTSEVSGRNSTHRLFLVDLPTADTPLSGRELVLPLAGAVVTDFRWAEDNLSVYVSLQEHAKRDPVLIRFDAQTGVARAVAPQTDGAFRSASGQAILRGAEFALRHATSVTHDKRHKATTVRGSVFVDGREVLHWSGYDEHTNAGCSRPIWLPDNAHLMVSCNRMLVMLEPASEKIAVFGVGSNPRWPSQRLDLGE